jgi:ankyrin repeat protein
MIKYLPDCLQHYFFDTKLQNMNQCWYEKAIELCNLKSINGWSAPCLDSLNQDGQTALLYLCKMTGEGWQATPNEYLELLRLMISKKVKINAKDRYGFTPLLWSCINGNTDFVKELVESGADLNSRNLIGTNPLQVVVQMACFTDNFEIANYIFDKVTVIENQTAQELIYIAKNYRNQKVLDWLAQRSIVAN